MQLMEMIQNAQNGQSVQRLARQFGLSQDQTNQALEALLPAFSTGLKRNTADPQNAGAFIQALSSGRHESFFDDGDMAYGEEGIREGNGILGHVFGSKDVSRAVAQRASAASGLEEGVLKKMLPSIASMLMGALFKRSTGSLGQPAVDTAQPANISGGGVLGGLLNDVLGGALGGQEQNRSSGSSGGGILGQIIEGLAGGALSGSRKKTRSSGRTPGTRRTRGRKANNPLGDIFEDMLGGNRSAPRKRKTTERRTSRRRGGNPLEDILGDFLGGGNTPGTRRRQPQRRSTTRRTRSAPDGGLSDIFGDLFETGGRQDNQGYRQEMEDVFDGFLRG